MSAIRHSRVTGAVTRIAGMLPLVWLFGVLWLYARAEMRLGYWPRPHIPDPKSLPFEIHYTALTVGVYAVPAAALLMLFLWCIRGSALGPRIFSEVIPFILGWTLIVVLFAFRATPIEWFD